MSKLPSGWKIKTLGEIATISSGGTPSRNNLEYWKDGSIPWIRTTEVQNCILNEDDTQEFITEKGLKNSSAKIVPKGTLLLAMIGQGKTRGQVAYLNFEASTNQNCATITFGSDYEPKFYFQYLLSQYENIRALSNSAGQSNLSGTLVKAIKVPVPTLPEQIKIAETLSTWDNAIQATESLITNSQQQKKALMQMLLSGEKRVGGFSGEWEQYSTSEIGKVVTGSTPQKSDIDNYGNEVCWATADDFKQKYITDTKVKLSSKGANKARIVPKGSVLVTCIASIGKNAIANIDLATNQQINAIIVNANINNEFVYYLIENSQEKLLSLAGTTAVPIVNKSTFEKIKLLFPKNLEEQQKIAEILTTADQEIETLQQKLERLKLEKQALMQRLLG
ncbi:hypothetical protein BMT54_11260 [Pasteurellaceae bacterium 15-036681]|nr:hypothetical protein BMT54_11260 [Pasteurellaceae bacterium 15-036681]